MSKYVSLLLILAASCRVISSYHVDGVEYTNVGFRIKNKVIQRHQGFDCNGVKPDRSTISSSVHVPAAPYAVSPTKAIFPIFEVCAEYNILPCSRGTSPSHELALEAYLEDTPENVKPVDIILQRGSTEKCVTYDGHSELLLNFLKQQIDYKSLIFRITSRVFSGKTMSGFDPVVLTVSSNIFIIADGPVTEAFYTTIKYHCGPLVIVDVYSYQIPGQRSFNPLVLDVFDLDRVMYYKRSTGVYPELLPSKQAIHYMRVEVYLPKAALRAKCASNNANTKQSVVLPLMPASLDDPNFDGSLEEEIPVPRQPPVTEVSVKEDLPEPAPN